jgi:hypothetical protein
LTDDVLASTQQTGVKLVVAMVPKWVDTPVRIVLRGGS